MLVKGNYVDNKVLLIQLLVESDISREVNIFYSHSIVSGDGYYFQILGMDKEFYL